MTPRLFAWTGLGGVLGLVVTAASACSDDLPIAAPCTNIPQGGCPVARGVSCDDPSCEAVYACRPGDVWELEKACPAREGGARVDGAVASSDAGAPFDAAIDAPPGAFGGPGCSSLVLPDCALGLALACGADCCGCEDLFVCREGGWDLWGSCGDGGVRQGGR